MKRFYHLVTITALLLLATNAFAQNRLIHYWHFNNYAKNQTTDTMHAINANYSSVDTNKTVIILKRMALVSPSYIARVDSYTAPAAELDTFNARLGAPAGFAMRVRNPTDSMQLLFYMPTNRFKNITMKYGCERSNNGMLQQVYDYSVDSGLTWRTSGLSVASDSPKVVFKLFTISLAGDTAVNNNPRFVFRIRFNGNDTGSSGNNRFDNVTLEGDTIMTTGIVQAPELISGIYPNPAYSQLTVSTTSNSAKTIVITDVNGKTMMTTTANSAKFPVNIASLEAGLYFIVVTEESTGNRSFSRFIKQ
ncbi:MAG: T9SS C-terminal target domain-containing protein [Chitinophagia bacterium]|nr:T9SS C-terminal target domain-containing protein [Chitinophagia bacterium]